MPVLNKTHLQNTYLNSMWLRVKKQLEEKKEQNNEEKKKNNQKLTFLTKIWQLSKKKKKLTVLRTTS